MMFRACSKCGRIHPSSVQCSVKRKYSGGEERKLRASWAWNKKSREIRERANHLCEVCRNQGRFTHENLEVHHIRKLTEYPEGLLEDANLVCLCTEHHKDADAGRIDAEYLKKISALRDERCPGGV